MVELRHISTTTISVRLFVILVFLLVQGTFLITFTPDSTQAHEWGYPGADDLAADYQRHLGDEAVVYGHVEDTDPVRISYDLDDGSEVLFTVTGLDESVQIGQYLEVYAVVKPDNTLAATNVVVVPERGHWYAYGISVVSGLWVFVRFIRHWRFDRRTIGFAPVGQDEHVDAGGADA